MDLPDKLYHYYEKLDAQKFNFACEKALNEIIKEDDNYIQKIDEFISQFERLM